MGSPKALVADRDGRVTDACGARSRGVDRARRRQGRSSRRVRARHLGPARRDSAVRRHQSARHRAVPVRRPKRRATARGVRARPDGSRRKISSSRACSRRCFAAARSTSWTKSTSPFNLAERPGAACRRGRVCPTSSRHEPETSWSNVSGGGRLSGTIGRVDVAAGVVSRIRRVRARCRSSPTSRRRQARLSSGRSSSGFRDSR